MDIYCGARSTITHVQGSLLAYEPENVLKSLANIEQLKIYLKCPSAVSILKNTYMIRCPFDYSFTYDKDGRISTQDYNQDVFNKSIGFQGSIDLEFPDIFQLSMSGVYVFADTEKKIQMTMQPPYMHESPVRDFTFLAGQYEPNKWFRPVQPSFWNKNKKPIILKRGDPLCYLHFDTTEKIRLRAFKCSEELFQISNTCLGVKEFERMKSLPYLYNLFTKNKLKKRILKEIKANLI